MKKQLTPRLPSDDQELAEKGFLGNHSRSKDWVTDGVAVFRFLKLNNGFLRDAIRHSDALAKVASDKIEQLWEMTEKARKVDASFIGCGRIGTGEQAKYAAFLRDLRSRLVLVNAYKLSFVLRCVEPDSMAISASLDPSERAVAFYRKGTMVAALMPMRYSMSDIENLGYDWKVDAIALEDIYAA